MNKWLQDLIRESGEGDELGANEMIGSVADAIESGGYDCVYDDIMNAPFPLVDPILGTTADIGPLGPRFWPVLRASSSSQENTLSPAPHWR